MRALPNEKASPGWGPGGSFEIERLGETFNERDKRTCPVVQPVFTAIPTGRLWAVKVVAPDGEETRVGRFADRLHALGAAVLLAEQVRGEVQP